MAKEGLIVRQLMLGVMQIAGVGPIYHEVFDGHTAQTRTRLPTLTQVLKRFPSVQRLVPVADRGTAQPGQSRSAEDRAPGGTCVTYLMAAIMQEVA